MAHVVKMTRQYTYDTIQPYTYLVTWDTGEVFDGMTGAALLKEIMTVSMRPDERQQMLTMYQRAQIPLPHRSLKAKLWLTTLDAEWNDKTCNYWYLVEANGYPHMGFTTRAALRTWMQNRHIGLTTPLPAHGVHSTQKLLGSYETVMHMDAVECYRIEGQHVRVVNNGDYTLAILAPNANGLMQEHVCHPNVKDRIVFDYAESAALCR